MQPASSHLLHTAAAVRPVCVCGAIDGFIAMIASSTIAIRCFLSFSVPTHPLCFFQTSIDTIRRGRRGEGWQADRSHARRRPSQPGYAAFVVVNMAIRPLSCVCFAYRSTTNLQLLSYYAAFQNITVSSTISERLGAFGAVQLDQQHSRTHTPQSHHSMAEGSYIARYFMS
ncbi:unnamed protein product [Heligmosomoides polygyrus]|uniref:7TM_GPCR_Srx domain-containing protein n=1 Tax=Heligmosomoides polygyrus TaxID=6339 RepID=A0A183FK37_HELPZ|nr:unnamed protein product [Heligmosomoides polygyrus]